MTNQQKAHDLWLMGLNTQQIADRLGISRRAASSAVARGRGKSKVKSSGHIVRKVNRKSSVWSRSYIPTSDLIRPVTLPHIPSLTRPHPVPDIEDRIKFVKRQSTEEKTYEG